MAILGLGLGLGILYLVFTYGFWILFGKYILLQNDNNIQNLKEHFWTAPVFWWILFFVYLDDMNIINLPTLYIDLVSYLFDKESNNDTPSDK